MRQTRLFKARLILPVLPIFFAVLALAGWALDIESFKHGMASGVAMNPATAVCLILLSLEAIRLNMNVSQAILSRGGQLAVTIVIVASAMKLSDLMFGSSFAVDQFLFSTKLGSETDYPSRMAPNTAVCFFILGWAMLLVRGRPYFSVFMGQVLAIAALLLALLALTGNIFNIQSMSGIAHYIPMAANTALAFMLISASVLFTFPHKSFMRVFAGEGSSGSSTITAILLPASIIIPFALGWLSHVGVSMGYYDAVFALAIAVIMNVVALLLISYITARRLFLLDAESNRINAVLHESDEAYRGILATSLDGFWLVDSQGKLLDVNNRYAEQSGYSREELLGMHIADLEAGESLPDTTAHIQRIIEKGGDQFESMHRRKDGSIWHVEISTTFLASNGGRFFVFVRDITERKNNQDALKSSLEFTNNLIGSMQDGFSVLSREGRAMDANSALCRMTGFSREELLGLNAPFPYWPPEEYENIQAAFQKTLEGEIGNYELIFMRKSGERFPVIVSPAFVKDSKGDIVSYTATVKDITERKRLEQALRHKEALFRELFENMGSAVAVYKAVDNGVDFTIQDFNRSAELAEKIKREQIMGKRITEAFPGVKEFGLFAVLQRVWNTGQPEHFPVTLYKDERIAGWRDNYVYRLPGGEVVAIYDDVTERKQMEAALRENDEAYRSILAASLDGFWLVDSQGRLLDVNSRYAEQSGYSREELLGMRIPDLEAAESAADTAAHIQHIIEKGGDQFESMHRRKNGSIWHVEVSTTFLASHGGRFFVFLRDITGRKQAEEQIRNLAFYDALTQLPNRRLLEDRLGQAMVASKRSGLYGALMFLDLDNFKPLNDAFGHVVGDLLLVEVARRISGCVRGIDTVARFGGDEFVVVLSELDAGKAESITQAGIVAEKIRAVLSEPYLLSFRREGEAETAVEHHCTSSIGAVIFINHEASPEEALKWADMAMYKAKEAGRNQIYFHDGGDFR